MILDKVNVEEESNPHIATYKKKLEELISAKLNSRDNFINWITGLATGSMLFALTNLASTAQNIRYILLYSAIAFFIGIISSIFFKALLEVRFFGLELDVKILKNLYDGHDLNTRLTSEIDYKGKVSEIDKQKLYQNVNESLDFLDPTFPAKLSKSQNIKFRLLDFSFWAAILLFIIGLFLIVVRYLLY